MKGLVLDEVPVVWLALPIAIIRFFFGSNLGRNTNFVLGQRSLGMLQFIVKWRATVVLNACIIPRCKLNKRQKEGTVTSYYEDIENLFEM